MDRKDRPAKCIPPAAPVSWSCSLVARVERGTCCEFKQQQMGYWLRTENSILSMWLRWSQACSQRAAGRPRMCLILLPRSWGCSRSAGFDLEQALSSLPPWCSRVNPLSLSEGEANLGGHSMALKKHAFVSLSASQHWVWSGELSRLCGPRLTSDSPPPQSLVSDRRNGWRFTVCSVISNLCAFEEIGAGFSSLHFD